MEESAFLKIDRATRRFGAFTAVDGVAIEQRRGEILALLGPNGAGKTTLIKMITGTLVPNAGKLTLNGHDCFSERDKCMAITGYVPDEPKFPPYARAVELLDFYGEMHGLSPSEIIEYATPLVKRLRMDEDLNEFAVNFSKGMKKKFAFVMAMLHNPSFMVFDELTNGLDPYATRELHQIMRDRAGKGCAILFSTHLLDQAERICDHLAIMHKGKIVSSGELEKLKKEGSLEELFFRHTGEAVETTDKTTAENR